MTSTSQTIILDVANQYPDKIALNDGERQATFREVVDESRRYGMQMAASKKDRFYLRGDNSIENICYMYGAIMSGKTLVLLPGFVPRFAVEMTKLSLRTTADVTKLKPAEAELPGGGHVVTFTSGTTGRPKAMAVSDYTLVKSNKYLLDEINVDADDEFFTTAPMMAVPMPFTIPLSIGNPISFIPEVTSDPYVVVSRLHDSGANCFSTTPSILEKVLDSVGPSELSHLKTILLATSPVSKRLMEKTKAIGCPVIDLYISSETGPIGHRDVSKESEFTLFPGVQLNTEYGKLSIQEQRDEHANGLFTGRGIEPMSYPLENGDLIIMDGSKIKAVDRHDGKVKVAGFAVNPNIIVSEAQTLVNKAITKVVRGEPSDSVELYVDYDGELSDVRTHLNEVLPWYYVPRVIRRIDEYRK